MKKKIKPTTLRPPRENIALEKDECKNLELDLKCLKNVLRDFGIYNIKVEL
jgi:hypothetical protein